MNPMTEIAADLPTLLEMLRETRFTMFTTHQGDRIVARPMTTLKATDDGSLWFFGVRDSELAQEVAADSRVGLAYADTGKGSYAFVTGSGHLREDPAKVEELWNPIHEAWYDGPDDPDLQLLQVRIDSAEYWDSHDSGVLRFLGVIKAAVTGDDHEVGEHGELKMDGTTTRPSAAP
jgi:general stress protein 26